MPMHRFYNDTVMCKECSMPVAVREYHPYAACLMYKQCKDASQVRANLTSITEQFYNLGHRAGVQETLVKYAVKKGGV